MRRLTAGGRYVVFEAVVLRRYGTGHEYYIDKGPDE
jgi:hypothetical protein